MKNNALKYITIYSLLFIAGIVISTLVNAYVGNNKKHSYPKYHRYDFTVCIAKSMSEYDPDRGDSCDNSVDMSILASDRISAEKKAKCLSVDPVLPLYLNRIEANYSMTETVTGCDNKVTDYPPMQSPTPTITY